MTQHPQAENREAETVPPLQRHPDSGVFRHLEKAPAQLCEKPYLAQLFADVMADLNLTTERIRHYGSMPDIPLPPSEISAEVEAEMRGMMITIPSMNCWGVFSSVRHTGVDAFTVVLDDEPIELNDATRLHVTARAWREAGGGEVEQHCNGVRGQEIPGHLGEHPRPDSEGSDQEPTGPSVS